jgi:hypothetical protein
MNSFNTRPAAIKTKMSDELVQHQTCGNKNKNMIKNAACGVLSAIRAKIQGTKPKLHSLLTLLKMHKEG